MEAAFAILIRKLRLHWTSYRGRSRFGLFCFKCGMHWVPIGDVVRDLQRHCHPYLCLSSLPPANKMEQIRSHCAKKPVTTMLTYPWKCTVLHCNHMGSTWKPLVLMTRHFDYCPSASEGDNQSVRSTVVSRCFPGGYNVKLYISRGRLAWWYWLFCAVSGLRSSSQQLFPVWICPCTSVLYQ